MSELGTLWTAAAGHAQENFTTAALSIAIARDPQPFLRALAALEWPEALPLDPVETLETDIQYSRYGVPGPDGGPAERGQLDLRVRGITDGSVAWEIWIEAKVAAGVSGGQLNVYERRWREEFAADPLRLVILSRERLLAKRPDGTSIPVAWLPWASVAAAIDDVAPADSFWRDFLALLSEWSIAGPPSAGDPIEGAHAVTALLWDLNALMRGAHPVEASSVWWPNLKTMAKHVLVQHQNGLGLTTTGVALRYGLATGPDGWRWLVRVDRKLAERNAAAVDELAARLDSSWERPPYGPVLAERTTPYPELPVGPDALNWIVESINGLRRAGLVVTRAAK
jgi:hypothetical protein